MPVGRSVALLGVLAGLVTAPALAAPPRAPESTDVTITVVSDPDELNEKVNRISLPPAADEPAKPSQIHDKEAERGKESEDAHQKAAHDAEDTKHEVGDKSQSDADDSKPEAPDPSQSAPGHTEAPDGD